ncbi:MAG: Hpt domain-containing protein [Parcubacteria group bacterium]
MSDPMNPKPQTPRFKFGGLDAAAIARAEAALKSLSTNFGEWMNDELAKLEAARERIRAEGFNAETAENLYFRAHDMKGLGTTYEFPLVTRMAASLCRVLHDPATRLSAPLAVLDAHIDAIGKAVRDQLRTDADPAGRTMAEDLENQVSRLTPAAA